MLGFFSKNTEGAKNSPQHFRNRSADFGRIKNNPCSSYTLLSPSQESFPISMIPVSLLILKAS